MVARSSKRRARVASVEWSVAFALALMFVFGLGLRLSGIDRIGFAEDEINKLDAVRAYEQGDIRPNAEHPMVMKSLMFVSMQAAHVWNAASNRVVVNDETALRLPNILFGALTALPLFLLTAAFFDRRTALLAAAFWTFGVNAITYNRIAKEDTLLVFFMLFAFYFYLRAKQTSGYDARRKHWYFSWSGVAFGLMLASKYFPHYFGLNALYHYLYRVRERAPGEPQWKTPVRFYLLMLIVFLLVNPAVLLPQTWAYLQAYTSGQLLTHSGYLMGEHLYKNDMASTPFRGTPVYFYLLFLAIKVPLPVLAAFIIGLVACVRRWRDPGCGFLLLMFVLWIVPYSLTGAKWLRYTLSLMPFVYMIAAVGLMSVIAWGAAFLASKGVNRPPQTLSAVALLLIFIAWPAWTARTSAPHYAAYVNALGGAHAAGYYFPHDEFYDDGLREAIRYVCEVAPRGALIVSETPGVVRYYTQKYGRTDLQSRVLSDPDFKITDAPPETYVVLQRGRTYFENRDEMEHVRAAFQNVFNVCVEGRAAAEIYALKTSDNQLAPARSCETGEP